MPFLTFFDFHAAYYEPGDVHWVYVVDRNTNTVVLSTTGRGRDASRTQAAALLSVCSRARLTLTQSRGYTLEWIDDADRRADAFLTSLRNVKGKNVVPCIVSPNIYSNVPRPMIPNTASWMDALYNILDKKWPYARAYFERTFFSTGNVTGYVTALENTVRERFTVDLKPSWISLGIVRIMKRAGWSPQKKITPPKITPHLLHRIYAPKSKKAGIVLAKDEHFLCAGTHIIFGHSGTKEEMVDAELRRLSVLLDYLYGPWDMEFFPVDKLPVLVSKFSPKTEVRQWNEDPEKVRIFFIPALLKYLAEVVIHLPFFEFCQGKGPNMIRRKWLGGGAHRLANYFRAFSSGRTYMWWDFSKFDQSLFAFLLNILPNLSLMIYDRTPVRDYMVIALLCAWLSNLTAAKIVKWVEDQWRYIIGIMFSGELGTSQWDTMYAMIVMETYFMWCQQEVKRTRGEDDLQRFNDQYAKGIICYICYGDDGGAGWPSEWDDIINPGSFIKFCSDKWALLVKPTAVGTSHDFFSRLDSENGCFSVKSFNILKRYFIRFVVQYNSGPKVIAMCCRSIEDYYGRVGRSVTDLEGREGALLQIARLRSFMDDSHGTNYKAYEYLRDSLNALGDIFEDIEMEFDRRLDAGQLDVGEEIRLFCRRNGHLQADFDSVSREAIFRRYVPDEDKLAWTDPEKEVNSIYSLI